MHCAVLQGARFQLTIILPDDVQCSYYVVSERVNGVKTSALDLCTDGESHKQSVCYRKCCH